MDKVSSIRWNDPQLYKHAQAYAELNDQKMNALIMEALSEYLRIHKGSISKLKLQTQAFSGDDFSMDAWVDGQETEGWE